MPGAQAFSKEERARVKWHLGYPSLQAFNTLALGFIAVSQPLFLVERSMDNLLDEAVPIVREHVAQLDSINAQIEDARKRMKATELGDIKLQAEETLMLRREYAYWAKSMADVLGCPINAYSEKFSTGMGLGAISIPVVQG